MATSNLPPASNPEKKIVEFIEQAVDSFTLFLDENVPLGVMDNTGGPPKFYSIRMIMMIVSMAKSQVISDYKLQLATEASEDEHSVETRVESLKQRLQTVVNAHLKENSRIWGTVENSIVTDLIKRLSEDLEKLHHGNLLPETERLKKHHEILRGKTMDSWSKLTKPNCADFIRDTEVKLQSKMNDLCLEYMRKHKSRLRELQEKGEVELAKLVWNFETELLAKKDEFGVTRNDEWTKFSVAHRTTALGKYLHSDLNPFPRTHSRHWDLYKLYAFQLEEARIKVDRRRWDAIYQEAARHCLALYLIPMERFLYDKRKNYVSKADLEAAHIVNLKESLSQWMEYHIEGEKAQEFKTALKKKIGQAYLLYQKQVGALNAEAEWMIKLLVKKCQNDYVLEMRKVIETFHKKYGDRARDVLRQGSAMESNSEDVTSKYEKELDDFLKTIVEKAVRIFKSDDDVVQTLSSVSSEPKIVRRSRSILLFRRQSKIEAKRVDITIERWPETECFEKLYGHEIRMKLHFAKLPKEKLEVFNEKLELAMVNAFKKFAVLEGNTEAEVAIKLDNLKRSFAPAKALEEKVCPIVRKMKVNYNERIQDILQENPEGVDYYTFFKHADELQEEILKLMETEIRAEIGEEKSLVVYREIMQRHFDDNLSSAMKINDRNLHLHGKDPLSRELPPLAIHLQSRHVSMAMEVEGNVTILQNDWLEDKTPGVVVLTREGKFVYGTSALDMLTSSEMDETPGISWSVADFFTACPTFAHYITLEGEGNKEHCLTSEFMLAFLLRQLKRTAERGMEGHYSTAIVAIPFWLSALQRRSVKNAGILAGFFNVHLVNEASAAAYDYLARLSNEHNFHQEMLVFCENMNRVDVLSYKYSGANQELSLVSHFGTYRKFKRKLELPASYQRIIKEAPETSSALKFQDKWEIYNAFCKCQKLGRFSKCNQHRLAILDNPARWETPLIEVFNKKDVKPDELGYTFAIKETDHVLAGAVLLGRHPSKIGTVVRDKLAWDFFHVKGVYSTASNRQLVISMRETLPTKSKRYTVSLEYQENEWMTFYQAMPLSDKSLVYPVGILKLIGLEMNKTTQNLQVIVEITNEGIISLYGVDIRSKTPGGETEYVANKNICWCNQFTLKKLMYQSELLDMSRRKKFLYDPDSQTDSIRKQFIQQPFFLDKNIHSSYSSYFTDTA